MELKVQLTVDQKIKLLTSAVSFLPYAVSNTTGHKMGLRQVYEEMLAVLQGTDNPGESGQGELGSMI